MRGLLIALVVANLLVLAWSLDVLPVVSRHREREPERLRQQVQPEAVQLITPTAASAALQAAAAQRSNVAAAPGPTAASAADASATVCLEAGPFAAGEVVAAERGLRELKWPSLEWTPQRSERGGSYIVYQGRFADDTAMARRRDDYRRQQITAEEVRNSPDLQPGLQFVERFSQFRCPNRVVSCHNIAPAQRAPAAATMKTRRIRNTMRASRTWPFASHAAQRCSK
jgi:hypothetical protein